MTVLGAVLQQPLDFGVVLIFAGYPGNVTHGRFGIGRMSNDAGFAGTFNEPWIVILHCKSPI
jgi:hypothetical protein